MNRVRGGFDRTLEAVKAKVIELSGMVAEDLPAVAPVFPGRHGDMAAAPADREQGIDALYRQVGELAGRELLPQAPVASDFRLVTWPRAASGRASGASGRASGANGPARGQLGPGLAPSGMPVR